MTPEEITAAALDYIRSEQDADEHSPRVAVTLAHWAAYGEPAELPPGWTAHGGFPGPTGIHQYATAAGGGFYNDAPARRIPWTCPAGVLHRRYWRSAHHPNRPALVACEHQAEPVRLHVG